MTTLAWAWIALLASVFVGGIVLYVRVVRPGLPEQDDEAVNVYGRFE